MQRTVSIITTCKGRLEHLKQTLPRMVEQGAAEIIVVDYSCPQGTAAYVSEHFPSVRVVSVEDEHFSNWRGRNAGAAVATSQLLLFCDADTILAPNAIGSLADALPPKSFGFFKRDATEHFNRIGLRLGANQLKGFLVIPSAAFRRLGGYDEVLQGYAAGGDTDMEERLQLAGLSAVPLEPTIVEDVIQHDNTDRTKHHADPIAISYAAGLIYRRAKMALLRLRHRLNLPIEIRQRLYDSAKAAARNLGSPRDTVSITIDVEKSIIGMPLQLGYRKAAHKVSLKVEVTGVGKVDEIPERI